MLSQTKLFVTMLKIVVDDAQKVVLKTGLKIIYWWTSWQPTTVTVTLSDT